MCIYDYMTIKRAQLFTTAALVEVFHRERLYGEEKNMMALLNMIRTIEVGENNQWLPSMEMWREDLFQRMKIKSENDLERLREISWSVTKKYALFCYQAIFDECDESIECIS